MTLCGRTKQHFHLHTDRFRIHRRTDPIGQADFFWQVSNTGNLRLHDGTSDIPPCSQYGGRFELASNLPLQSVSKIKPIWSVYEMAGSLNENRPK